MQADGSWKALFDALQKMEAIAPGGMPSSGAGEERTVLGRLIAGIAAQSATGGGEEVSAAIVRRGADRLLAQAFSQSLGFPIGKGSPHPTILFALQSEAEGRLISTLQQAIARAHPAQLTQAATLQTPPTTPAEAAQRVQGIANHGLLRSLAQALLLPIQNADPLLFNAISMIRTEGLPGPVAVANAPIGPAGLLNDPRQALEAARQIIANVTPQAFRSEFVLATRMLAANLIQESAGAPNSAARAIVRPGESAGPQAATALFESLQRLYREASNQVNQRPANATVARAGWPQVQQFSDWMLQALHRVSAQVIHQPVSAGAATQPVEIPLASLTTTDAEMIRQMVQGGVTLRFGGLDESSARAMIQTLGRMGLEATLNPTVRGGVELEIQLAGQGAGARVVVLMDEAAIVQSQSRIPVQAPESSPQPAAQSASGMAQAPAAGAHAGPAVTATNAAILVRGESFVILSSPGDTFDSARELFALQRGAERTPEAAFRYDWALSSRAQMAEGMPYEWMAWSWLFQTPPADLENSTLTRTIWRRGEVLLLEHKPIEILNADAPGASFHGFDSLDEPLDVGPVEND